MTVVDSLILLLVAAPFLVLGLEIVQHWMRTGWVLVMAAFSAGELAGGIASGRARLRRPLVAAALGLLFMAFPPLVLVCGGGVGWVCAAEFGAGLGISAYGVLVNTAIQRLVPADYLARVSAISSVGSFAGCRSATCWPPRSPPSSAPARCCWSQRCGPSCRSAPCCPIGSCAEARGATRAQENG
jgi:hypothetical protein